jgi:hypothetical protein
MLYFTPLPVWNPRRNANGTPAHSAIESSLELLPITIAEISARAEDLAMNALV